jgi:hypothetical protein
MLQRLTTPEEFVGMANRSSAKRRAKYLPTPTARDYRSGKGKTQAERGRSAGPSFAEVSGGTLNPMWVEWLMGFPAGWTDLEDSETQ